MPYDIGPKIGVDGEAEFRAELNRINTGFKTLSSEMKVVTSSFLNNENSVEALTAKNDVLDLTVSSLNDRLKLQKKMLQESTQKYGEADERTMKWQQTVNNTQAEINKYTAEIEKNAAAVKSLGQEDDKFKTQLSAVDQTIQLLGREMSSVTAKFTDQENSMKSLHAQHKLLKETVSEQKEKLSLLKSELKNAEKQYGKTDEKTRELAIAVNEATGDLNKSKAALEENSYQLKHHGKTAEEAAEQHKKLVETLGGIAKAAAAATAAVAAAAFELGKTVVTSFGELEQNLGGSEAVFGEYAKTIQKEGEEAYKNLGVSQSEYLATANKVGALFQGSGVEQQRSLELTTQAMQRAADMASVMGIETDSALEAITGAAKGNYTMMDNLGVAMNATTLEAYRVEKGFKTAFSSMSNAEKAEVAMQYFFENTAQYAGNFARESTETISGSMGLLTSSIQSLVAGLGNSEADISNLAGNVIDAFLAVTENVVPVIENIAVAFPAALSEAMAAISPMLPELLAVGVELFQSVLDGILSMLPELLATAGTLIGTLVAGILDNLPALIEGAMEIILTLTEGIADSLPELIPTIVEVVLTIVETLIDNVDTMVDAAIAIIAGLAEGLIGALPKLLEKAPMIVQKLVAAIIRNVPKLLSASVQIIARLVVGIAENLPQLLEAAAEIVFTIIEGIVELLGELVMMGKDLVDSVKNGFSEKAESAKQWGKDLIKNFIDGIKQKWEDLKATVSNVAQTVKDYLGFSEPKNGPLSDFHTYGPDMMALFISGIESKRQDLIDEVTNIAQIVSDTLNGITKTFDLKSDISSLEYTLWEKQYDANNTLLQEATERLKLQRSLLESAQAAYSDDATEEHLAAVEAAQAAVDALNEQIAALEDQAAIDKYNKKQETLSAQMENQASVVDAAYAALEQMIQEYGEGSDESLAYQKTLLQEQIAYEELLESIKEVITAKEELGIIDTGFSAGFSADLARTERSLSAAVAMPQASTADLFANAVNGIQTAIAGFGEGVDLTVNVVASDGTLLGRAFVDNLFSAARSYGKPIQTAI